MTQPAFVGTTGGPPPSAFGFPPIDLGTDEGGVAITFDRLRNLTARFQPQPNQRNPGQFFFDILRSIAGIIPGVFPGTGAGPRDRPSGTGTLRLPPGGTPAPPGTLEDPGIIATATSEIITIPPAIIRRFPTPNVLPRFPSGGSGDGMPLPEFFGTGPGFDIGDIFDIGGRILGDPTVPFGGFNSTFGGEPLNVAQTRVNGGNGGTQQLANGACPPARARMPSSIMADDPCSPTNPTIYIMAGKASAALWPAVIRSQAKRLGSANKSIPKKVVRRKKK